MWAALIDKFSSKPSWGWIDNLRLVSLDNGNAVLEPVAGQSQIAAFLSDAKRKQIAENMAQIIGKPVKVTVRQAENKNNIASNTQAAQANNNNQNSGDRQIAMELDLVKQALNVFPDATLINVR